MIALRDCEHISLAFVRSDFHRQGIGRMLYAAAKAEALSHGTKRITVNASDCGIPFYHAMGLPTAFSTLPWLQEYNTHCNL